MRLPTASALLALVLVGCGGASTSDRQATPAATDDSPAPALQRDDLPTADEASEGSRTDEAKHTDRDTPATRAVTAASTPAAQAVPNPSAVLRIEPACDQPMPTGNAVDDVAEAAAWLDLCDADPEGAGERLIVALEASLDDPECPPPPGEDSAVVDRPGAVPECVAAVFEAGRAGLGDGSQAPMWQLEAGATAAAYGDMLATVGWLEPMLAAQPDHPRAEEAALLLVSAYGWLGRLNDARQLGRAWSETSPVFDEMLAYLEARVCSDMDFGSQPLEVAECWDAIAESFPDEPFAATARYNACVAWETGGEVEPAHRCYADVVTAWPESDVAVDAGFRQCHAAYHVDVDGVAECFASYSERHPDGPHAADALLAACTVAFENDDRARARTCATRFVDRFPDHPEAASLRNAFGP